MILDWRQLDPLVILIGCMSFDDAGRFRITSTALIDSWSDQWASLLGIKNASEVIALVMLI